MSVGPQGPGWWQASDRKWYPPQQQPNYGAPQVSPGAQQSAFGSPQAPFPSQPSPMQPPASPPSVPFAGQQAQPPWPGGYPAGAGGYAAGAPVPSGYGPPAEPVVGIGAAFNYAMSKFQTNAREILIAGVICVLALIVLVLMSYFIVLVGLMGAAEDESGGGMLMMLVAVPLFALVPLMGQWLFQMVIIRGSLMIVNGQTPLSLNRMFSVEQIGSYLLGAVLVSIGTAVGFMLCIIPGLLFFFFSAYWGYFVIGKQLSPVDAIKASFTFVNKNLGSLLLLFLASMVVYWLGALFAFFGLIVAVPLIVIAQGFMWRRLQGEPVAP